MVLSTDPTTSDDPRVEKKSIRDADCSATLKLLTGSGSFVLFASKSESQILGLQQFSIKDESGTKGLARIWTKKSKHTRLVAADNSIAEPINASP